MQKTVVVTVRRRAAHRKYGKILTLREKYKAHAEDHDYPKNPTLHEGDRVRIAETRPPARTSAGGWSRCSSAGRASKDGGRP
jgi:small subunit ribosomal protein S17